MIADIAIHAGNDEENNIYAQIMTSLRPINENEKWQAKSKKQGYRRNPNHSFKRKCQYLRKKSIETDKGNINRKIKNHNSLVKAIRERIKELKVAYRNKSPKKKAMTIEEQALFEEYLSNSDEYKK